MSPSRKTRLQTGKLADVLGVYKCPHRRKLVEIRKSNICDGGRGVFANIFIKRGTLITNYASDIKPRNSTDADDPYVLDMSDFSNTKEDTDVYVGISDTSKLEGRGVAQLANDAISATLTGYENNTSFEMTTTGVYLMATRDIETGEELFVPYGIGYWFGQLRNNPEKYSKLYRVWFDYIGFIQEELQKIDKLSKIFDVKDFVDDNVLEIRLEKNDRKCPYINMVHFDDKVHIKLTKNNDGKFCDMYYRCHICQRDSYHICTYELDDSFID